MSAISPSAFLLLIGNELLSGRTQDKNLAFVGRRLSELGIRLTEARVIPDDSDAIIHNVNDSRRRFDYVFTTGGIGPTHDDITSAAVARAFDQPLERHPQAEQRLRAFYGSDVNDARLRMADMPAGAILVDNPLSGAPGFQIENVFVLAGIPAVMQAMFDGLADRLRHGRPILSRTLTTDRREGALAAGMRALQNRYPELTIGSYPFFSPENKGVNIVVSGTDAELLNAVIEELRELVHSLDGQVKETGMTQMG